ncbi:MAG: aminotransferase class I/II-fold pyridoxal phosphate-dependent enzyme, partial [Ruminococcus sp.]|nr:aminotransferase class I/II-fold pyridoxal phosphate-dependent enzyme [Ruminococcus sp.]
TGRLISRETVLAAAAECRRTNTVFVLDMCFADFAENTGYDPAELIGAGAVLIKAFTKIYAMAGLRLGYMLCGDRELIRRSALAGAEWSVSVPAQAAGAAAFEDKDFLRRTREYIAGEREYLYSGLDRLRVEYTKSDANFILLRSDLDLYGMLLERGILIRKCGNFYGLSDKYYRIAVRTRRENALLLEALERGISDG